MGCCGDKTKKREREKNITKVKMAKNLTSALYKHAKNGFANVGNDVYKTRIDTCLACDRLDNTKMRCKECRCFVQLKAKMPFQSCPLNKWLAIETKNDKVRKGPPALR